MISLPAHSTHTAATAQAQRPHAPGALPAGGDGIALPMQVVQQSPALDPISIALPHAEHLLKHEPVKAALEQLFKSGHGFVPGPHPQQVSFRGTADSACILLRALMQAGPTAWVAARTVFRQLQQVAGFPPALCMTLSQELQRMLDEGQTPPVSLHWAWAACTSEALSRKDYAAVVRFATACPADTLGAILKLTGMTDPAIRVALVRAGFPMARCVDELVQQCDKLVATPKGTAQAIVQLGALVRLWPASRDTVLRERLIGLAQRLLGSIDRSQGGSILNEALIMGHLNALLAGAGEADTTEYAAVDLQALEQQFSDQVQAGQFAAATNILREVRSREDAPKSLRDQMFFHLWTAIEDDAGPIDGAQNDPEVAVKHAQLAGVLLKFGGEADAEYAARQMRKLFEVCTAPGSRSAEHADQVQVLLLRAIERTLLQGQLSSVKFTWKPFLAMGRMDWAVPLYRSIVRSNGCTPDLARALLHDLRDGWNGALSSRKFDEGRAAEELQLAKAMCEFGGQAEMRLAAQRLEVLLAICQADDSACAAAAEPVRRQLLAVAVNLLEVGAVEEGLDLWTKHGGGRLELALPAQRARLPAFIRTLLALSRLPKADRQRLQQLLLGAWHELLDSDAAQTELDCHLIVAELAQTVVALWREEDTDRALARAHIENPTGPLLASKLVAWTLRNGLDESTFITLVHLCGPVSDAETLALLQLQLDGNPAATGQVADLVNAATYAARLLACLEQTPPDLTLAEENLLWIDPGIRAALVMQSGFFRQAVCRLLISCATLGDWAGFGRVLHQITDDLVVPETGGLPADAVSLLQDMLEHTAEQAGSSTASRVCMLRGYILSVQVLLPPPRVLQRFLTPEVLAELESQAQADNPGAKRSLIAFLRRQLGPIGPAIGNDERKRRLAECLIRLLQALPETTLAERKTDIALRLETRSGLAWWSALEDDINTWSIMKTLVLNLQVNGVLGLLRAFGVIHQGPPVASPAAALQPVLQWLRAAPSVGGAPQQLDAQMVAQHMGRALGIPGSALERIAAVLGQYPEALSAVPSMTWDANLLTQPWDQHLRFGQFLTERLEEVRAMNPEPAAWEWSETRELILTLTSAIAIAIFIDALWQRFKPR